MTSFELRPLALGELLDRSFTLYRRHFTLFVGIMAVPSIFTLMFALIMAGAGLSLMTLDPNTPPRPDVVLPLIGGMFVAMFAFIAAYWVVYVVALGATTMAVAEVYAGRPVTIRAAYARVKGQIWRLMVLTIVAALRVLAPLLAVGVFAAILVPMSRGVPVMLGVVVFISLIGMFGATILMFYLSLRYVVAVPALVLEHVTPMHAIRRSITLTKGSLGRVCLLVLCAIVVAYATMAIFQGPFTAGSMIAGQETSTGLILTLLGIVSGTIGNTVSAPFMVIGLSVLYYDLRVRKEALDLQLMLGALDTPAGSASGAPSTALPGLSE